MQKKNRIPAQEGYTLIISLVILFVVTSMGIGVITKSANMSNMENNITSKLQSFYASDAVMTTLAQEIYDNKFLLYKSNDLLISDNFGRPNSNTLDSGWVEVAEDSVNKISLNGGSALFKSTENTTLRPLMKKSFTSQSSGKLVWLFDINWGRTHIDSTYELMMQMGKTLSNTDKFANVGVALRWGDKKTTGFTSEESFGYYTSSTNGVQLKTFNGLSHIKVVINLDTKKYDIYHNNYKIASNIAFVTAITSVNEIRFATNKISTFKMHGFTIDNVMLYKENTGTFAFTDTFTYNPYNVAWSIENIDFNEYTIKTYSFSSKSKIQSRLNQFLQLETSTTVNTYPDSLSIPVRFYDFHSDRSNFEFEQPYMWEDSLKNLVGKQLTLDGKPSRGPNKFLNYYVQYWFMDSRVIPSTDKVYKYSTTMPFKTAQIVGEYWKEYYIVPSPGWPTLSGTSYSARTVFSNKIIDTTLRFSHLGSGSYYFADTTFFPLDGKGFGNEWNAYDPSNGTSNPHNYSYTMEIHRPFYKVPGLTFKFKGDDDVWCFINDSLVLDLGGIHNPKSHTIHVDSLKNLKDNTFYNFDFFYCERHSRGASIQITTNLFEYKPTVLPKKYWKRDYGSFFN
jgi:fibro-slime domain-containing protein